MLGDRRLLLSPAASVPGLSPETHEHRWNTAVLGSNKRQRKQYHDPMPVFSGGRGREFESRHSDQLFKHLASRPSRLSRILAHPSSQEAGQRRLARRAQDRPWASPASPLARSKQKKPIAAPVPDLRCSPGGFRFPPVREPPNGVALRAGSYQPIVPRIGKVPRSQ